MCHGFSAHLHSPGQLHSCFFLITCSVTHVSLGRLLWCLFWDVCGCLGSPGLSRTGLEVLGPGAPQEGGGQEDQSPAWASNTRLWPQPRGSFCLLLPPTPPEWGTTSTLPLPRGIPYLHRPACLHTCLSCKRIETPHGNTASARQRPERRKEEQAVLPPHPSGPGWPTFTSPPAEEVPVLTQRLMIGQAADSYPPSFPSDPACSSPPPTPRSGSGVRPGKGGGSGLQADDRPVSHRERSRRRAR